MLFYVAIIRHYPLDYRSVKYIRLTKILKFDKKLLIFNCIFFLFLVYYSSKKFTA